MGAVLQFPDLSCVPDFLSTLTSVMDKGNEFDLNELLKIQQGVAKGQWTGRIERDGIMDQFMDFNLSNLVLDAWG